MLEEIARSIIIYWIYVESTGVRMQETAALYPSAELVRSRDEIVAVGGITS